MDKDFDYDLFPDDEYTDMVIAMEKGIEHKLYKRVEGHASLVGLLRAFGWVLLVLGTIWLTDQISSTGAGTKINIAIYAFFFINLFSDLYHLRKTWKEYKVWRRFKTDDEFKIDIIVKYMTNFTLNHAEILLKWVHEVEKENN